ncbi:MAG: NAD(P)-dependent glycerol-3-phosphate dehydrogenase [Elusimicrobia bacterium]|jgi:glycerol-3-phosphate dehydrogenase (NAD(P)+)|nr:NAD(P)-dependent glycerol-3-phosphate dehydrogenase [Elusimicrobiota bacterium]
MNERIAVLGGGSWGATLADHLAKNGHDVFLWEFVENDADRLKRTRRLPTLPPLVLHDSVQVTSRLGEALSGRSVLVNAVPSTHVRSTFQAVKKTDALLPGAWVVSVSKGIENDSLKRMSEVIAESDPRLAGRVAVLAGPSHAEEVARSLPAAVVAAGPDTFRQKIVDLFNADHLRVYTNPDFTGVELCGALKNVFAVACGVSDGLGFGDNTKAALMTRGLNEMVRLGMAEGAQVITFLGLAGLGDLIVTCTSQHSRNRSLGEKLGSGKTAKEALAEMTMVAEGFPTTKSAMQLALRHGLDLPIILELYHILYEGKPARDAMRDLLSRPPVPEMMHIQSFIKQMPS